MTPTELKRGAKVILQLDTNQISLLSVLSLINCFFIFNISLVNAVIKQLGFTKVSFNVCVAKNTQAKVFLPK